MSIFDKASEKALSSAERRQYELSQRKTQNTDNVFNLNHISSLNNNKSSAIDDSFAAISSSFVPNQSNLNRAVIINSPTLRNSSPRAHNPVVSPTDVLNAVPQRKKSSNKRPQSSRSRNIPPPPDPELAELLKVQNKYNNQELKDTYNSQQSSSSSSSILSRDIESITNSISDCSENNSNITFISNDGYNINDSNINNGLCLDDSYNNVQNEDDTIRGKSNNNNNNNNSRNDGYRTPLNTSQQVTPGMISPYSPFNDPHYLKALHYQNNNNNNTSYNNAKYDDLEIIKSDDLQTAKTAALLLKSSTFNNVNNNPRHHDTAFSLVNTDSLSKTTDSIENIQHDLGNLKMSVNNTAEEIIVEPNSGNYFDAITLNTNLQNNMEELSSRIKLIEEPLKEVNLNSNKNENKIKTSNESTFKTESPSTIVQEKIKNNTISTLQITSMDAGKNIILFDDNENNNSNNINTSPNINFTSYQNEKLEDGDANIYNNDGIMLNRDVIDNNEISYLEKVNQKSMDYTFETISSISYDPSSLSSNNNVHSNALNDINDNNIYTLNEKNEKKLTPLLETAVCNDKKNTLVDSPLKMTHSSSSSNRSVTPSSSSLKLNVNDNISFNVDNEYKRSTTTTSTNEININHKFKPLSSSSNNTSLSTTKEFDNDISNKNTNSLPMVTNVFQPSNHQIIEDDDDSAVIKTIENKPLIAEKSDEIMNALLLYQEPNNNNNNIIANMSEKDQEVLKHMIKVWQHNLNLNNIISEQALGGKKSMSNSSYIIPQQSSTNNINNNSNQNKIEPLYQNSLKDNAYQSNIHDNNNTVNNNNNTNNSTMNNLNNNNNHIKNNLNNSNNNNNIDQNKDVIPNIIQNQEPLRLQQYEKKKFTVDDLPAMEYEDEYIPDENQVCVELVNAAHELKNLSVLSTQILNFKTDVENALATHENYFTKQELEALDKEIKECHVAFIEATKKLQYWKVKEEERKLYWHKCKMRETILGKYDDVLKARPRLAKPFEDEQISLYNKIDQLVKP